MAEAKQVGGAEQEQVNKVWEGVWQEQQAGQGSYRRLFRQRLFIEAYAVFRRYVPPEARTIVEVGGGTGRYGMQIALDLPQAAVTITDIVPASLTLIERAAAELNLTNVTAVSDDLMSSKLPPQSFDVVLSDAVVQHLHDHAAAVAALAQLVKPGGRLIVSSVNRWNFHTLLKTVQPWFGHPYRYGYEHSFSGGELAGLVRRAGLRVVAVDGFYPAYGIYRLKYIHPWFALVGRVCNRATKVLDSLTGRFISRWFGFEVVVVAERPKP